MKDPLAPFIAAYRAENPGTALDARAVRERVLSTTWRRRRRRLRRAVWLLPIAAVLVGSGALAASAPARESVARVLVELGVLPSPVAAPARTSPAARRRAEMTTRLPVASPSATAALASEIPVETAAVVAVPAATTAPFSPELALAPNAALAPRPRRPLPNSPNRAPAPASPRDVAAAAEPPSEPTHSASRASDAVAADIATYRGAHELHFVRADYARALAAWDAYLARYPAGTFAPEAHLNRAVCLARLGKTAEAERALHALATSESVYTSRQARRLLAALSER